MITTEELYILRDGVRYQVDLSTPSGITLSYESNLFNALDKVNCNRSYTIKLPKTTNNTQIFYIPQDVRNASDVPRKKITCEYVIDGVSMFKKGNAYVASIDDYINIVITWDVIDGFKKLKDDNFDINLFDKKEGVETAIIEQKTNLGTSEPFNNFEPYYRPSYYLGVKSLGDSFDSEFPNYNGEYTKEEARQLMIRLYGNSNADLFTENRKVPAYLVSQKGWDAGTEGYCTVLCSSYGLEDADKIIKEFLFVVIQDNGNIISTTEHSQYREDLQYAAKQLHKSIVRLDQETDENIVKTYNVGKHLIVDWYKTWQRAEYFGELLHQLQEIYFSESGKGTVSMDINPSTRRGDSNGNNWNYDDYKRRYMLPVVPVPYLIKRIENYFGIRLDIYSNAYSDGKSNIVKSGTTDDVIDFGVVPCITSKLTWEQTERARIRYYSLFATKGYTPSDLFDDNNEMAVYAMAYQFYGFNPNGEENDFFKFTDKNNTGLDDGYATYGVTPKTNKNVYARGVVKVVYSAEPVNNFLEDDKQMKLTFHTRKKVNYANGTGIIKYEDEEIGAVEGEIRTADQDNEFNQYLQSFGGTSRSYVCVVYDMRQEEGKAKVSLATEDLTNIWFSVTIPSNNYLHLTTILSSSYVEYLPESKEEYPVHKQDLISNLPSVSCLDFVKSLFYQIGAFPKIMPDGSIKAMYYNDILKNIPYAEDWTDKIIDEKDTISWKVGGFSRKNYYLMKSDKTDEDKKNELNPDDDPNEPKDVYEDGAGVVEVFTDDENTITTIVTLPWHAPFISAAERPLADTGNTMKYWVFGSDEAKAAKPCYGVLSYGTLNDGITDNVIKMNVWNGFNGISTTTTYGWLCSLLKNPLVLKCNLILNAFDLANLDMQKPVYIDKYNSYFCIIKVERGSNGISTAELLRIPSESL